MNAEVQLSRVSARSDLQTGTEVGLRSANASDTDSFTTARNAGSFTVARSEPSFASARGDTPFGPAAPVAPAEIMPTAPAGVPPCLTYASADGTRAVLRYAAMTADGHTENRFAQEMREGDCVDYALRGAVEAWGEQRPWTNAATCPISLKLFTDPVLAPDGYTYERHYLTQWLRTRNTSPCTGASLVPDDAQAPYHIRVTSHAAMRACAAWVLAHDPSADILDDASRPLAYAPPLHSDIAVHVPPPGPRAVPGAGIAGMQAPVGHLPPVPVHPPRPPLNLNVGDALDAGFFGGTLALYGCALALGMIHATKDAGAVLVFAAPLGAATGTLLARHFVNRDRRARGVAPV